MRREDWPQTFNVPVLDNQRSRYFPSKTARAAAKRAAREGNCDRHLFLIRQLPCAVCPEHRRTQVHHLRSGIAARERGVGLRAPDRRAVPLCLECHTAIHCLGSRRELEFFDEHAIDPYALAEALWVNSGNGPRMNRVLLAHKLAASRILVGRKA